MSWKIRHEGSPKSMEGLTPAQVVEGLQDGLWEATDEVMDSALRVHRGDAEGVRHAPSPPQPNENAYYSYCVIAV